MAQTRLDSITGLGDTEVVRRITEANTGVTYRGKTRIQSASTSEGVWQISRTVEVGNTTEIEFANKGKYNQIWDDRTSLFGPSGAFTNARSTAFDGVDEFCTTGNNLNFDNASAWSASFWLNPNNLAAQRCIWSKVTNDASVLGIGIYHTNTGGILVQMRASGQLRSFTTNTYSLSASVWNHLVVTYDGGQNINGLRVYIDNNVDSTPGSGTITNTLLTTENANFGRRNTGFYYSGLMDEITWWDKALSAAEVTELYNSGLPKNPAELTFSSNLLHHWRMGDVDTVPTIFDQGSGGVDLTMFNMDSTNFDTDVP